MIERPVRLRDRLDASFAGGAHQIEQALDFGVIDDDSAIAVDVDQVVGMKAVLLVVLAPLGITSKEFRRRKAAAFPYFNLAWV